MKIYSALTAIAFTAATLPLAAQTLAPHRTTPLHRSGAHHAGTASGCATLPEISPKIPALPAGLPCAKPLYTLTTTPETRLDYASPLVTPELRAVLAGEKATYSLDYVDTEIGTGPLAQPGKFYTVHYTGYLTNGTKFDSSIDRGKPITFPYGKHRVIEGWDTGFEGMHVGGKRRLYIPYQLAYGEAGRPPVIPAKSELVFDVELIGQSDAPPAANPPTAPRQSPTPPPAAKLPTGATGATTPPPAAKPPQ